MLNVIYAVSIMLCVSNKPIMLIVVMPSFVMLSVVMQSVVMLTVIMLCVIMLSVVMLSVAAPYSSLSASLSNYRLSFQGFYKEKISL
jgi:hypothetical protein